MVRKSMVAGTFYPEDPRELQTQMDDLWPDPAPQPAAALGAMVPHAGYIYSGRTAAAVYARLEPADIVLLIGPNHTGRGAPVAIAPEQAWETPLGRVPLDAALGQAILQHCPQAKMDGKAHAGEHSLEVQLPFLQRPGKRFSLVALALGTWELTVLFSLGTAIAEAVRNTKNRVLILASSDMNHFKNLEATRRLDQIALEQIEAMDPEGLMKAVVQNKISMCGAGPAAVLLLAARQLGAVAAERIAYTTSADASGDEDRVVGYAGVVVR